MSAISAWEMTFGKLFGSTALVGLGALICIIYAAIHEPTQEMALIMMAQYISIFIIVISISIAYYMTSLRSGIYDGITFSQLSSLLICYFIFWWLYPILFEPEIHNKFIVNSKFGKNTIWFGKTIEFNLFFTITLIAMAVMVIFSVYRLMRIELQYRS
jgi:hypothetical protein